MVLAIRIAHKTTQMGANEQEGKLWDESSTATLIFNKQESMMAAAQRTTFSAIKNLALKLNV
jgi:hypothetical protein